MAHMVVVDCGDEACRACFPLPDIPWFWTQVAAAAALALYVAHTGQVVPVGLRLPERRSHEADPADAYPEIWFAITDRQEGYR